MRPLLSWNPIVLILAIIAIWSTIGLPVSLLILRWSRETIGFGDRRLCVIASPLLGFCVSALGGLIALRLHLDQGEVLLGLFVLSASVSLTYRRFLTEFFPTSIERWRWLGTVTILVLLSVISHSSDLSATRLEDYFPRTNDDTFAYMGLIDQIIAQQTLTPPMSYPSGLTSQYPPDIRDGVTSMVAGLAELLRLDTHVAFFSVQRSFLPMAGAGVFVICALLEWPFALCAAIAILFLVGNFACHQVFQQFLSSGSGLVSSLGALFLLGLAVRANFASRLIVLAALAAGTQALLSPESHPLFLAGIAVGFGSLLLSGPRFQVNAIQAFALFIFVCITTIIIALPHLYQAIWTQTSVIKGHPGDWIAQMAFFGQWLGISVIAIEGVKPVSTFSWSVQILLLVIIALGLISFFTVRSAEESTQSPGPRLSRMVGGALVAWIGFFFAFLWMGRGYAMLKTTDYFCFAPALCLGAALDNAFKFSSPQARRHARALTAASALLFVLYAPLAYENKLSLLALYKTNVAVGPPLSAYQLPNQGTAAVVLPDFSGNALGGSGPLDLFLYCNRWTPIQIVFPPEDSVRYRPATTEFAPDHIFRFGTNPLPTEGFMDINRPPAQQMPPLHELIENRGYVRLSTPALTPLAAWSGAEGNLKDGVFRWLAADVGPFRVYRSVGASFPLHLNVRVKPGPDFRPDNRIRVIVDNQTIGEISPPDCQENHRFPLPSFASAFVECSLQIQGSRGGIHRVAVLSVYVD